MISSSCYRMDKPSSARQCVTLMIWPSSFVNSSSIVDISTTILNNVGEKSGWPDEGPSCFFFQEHARVSHVFIHSEREKVLQARRGSWSQPIWPHPIHPQLTHEVVTIIYCLNECNFKRSIVHLWYILPPSTENSTWVFHAWNFEPSLPHLSILPSLIDMTSC
jgi:hypothetical protein